MKVQKKELNKQFIILNDELEYLKQQYDGWDAKRRKFRDAEDAAGKKGFSNFKVFWIKNKICVRA